jgi:replicative DNA helicase
MTERIPPHNTEAEVGVLGSMILDTDMAGDIVQILTPEDFYHSKNSKIYSALLELYDFNRQPDSVLLRERRMECITQK